MAQPRARIYPIDTAHGSLNQVGNAVAIRQHHLAAGGKVVPKKLSSPTEAAKCAANQLLASSGDPCVMYALPCLLSCLSLYVFVCVFV